MTDTEKIEQEVRKARERLEEAERRLREAKGDWRHDDPPTSGWMWVRNPYKKDWLCYRPYESNELAVMEAGGTFGYLLVEHVRRFGWKPVKGEVTVLVDGEPV